MRVSGDFYFPVKRDFIKQQSSSSRIGADVTICDIWSCHHHLDTTSLMHCVWSSINVESTEVLAEVVVLVNF